MGKEEGYTNEENEPSCGVRLGVLKPCPFCGGEALYYNIAVDPYIEYSDVVEDENGLIISCKKTWVEEFKEHVVCSYCGCSGPIVYYKHRENKGKAIEMWNRRI